MNSCSGCTSCIRLHHFSGRTYGSSSAKIFGVVQHVYCVVSSVGLLFSLFPCAWFIVYNLDTVLTTVKLRKHAYWLLLSVLNMVVSVNYKA